MSTTSCSALARAERSGRGIGNNGSGAEDAGRLASRAALCIPTLNAGPHAAALLASIQEQSLQPARFVVIDSASADGSPALFVAAGARVISIGRSEFNHGATRQMAVEQSPGAEILLFLTHDAIPAGPEAFRTLLRCFEDPTVGAAYGRQLPREGANPVEAHARIFNYPGTSRTKSRGDAPELGLKTAFISNSFAAYRRTALAEAGGFPGDVILGEDTCVAARMLLLGWRVAYCAQAAVYHSHAYSLAGEFRRYFDTGVLHARQPWIRREFGQAGGEGLRYVLSELRFLRRQRPGAIPAGLLRNGLKMIGYRLGMLERWIPRALKARLSMNRAFWARP